MAERFDEEAKNQGGVTEARKNDAGGNAGNRQKWSAPGRAVALVDACCNRLLQNPAFGAKAYVAALCLGIAAISVADALAPGSAGFRFLLLFPVAALCAGLAGFGPGLATTLSALLPAHFSVPPALPPGFGPNGYGPAFLLAGSAVSAVAAILRRQLLQGFGACRTLQTTLKQNQDQEAELRYQKFALDQHAIVAVTDVRGTITYVNDLFCVISGYPREELIGRNHRLLNSGIHPLAFFQDMYRTITRGQVWKGDICNRAKDGGLYWVATTIVPYVNHRGKPERYIAIRADITERKRAEEAASAAALAKSQFLANMSHEIRTPMNAILGLTRQVIESDLKPEQREQLNKVRKSGQALVRIINDILDFSKIESNRMAIERVPMRLESVVVEVVDLFGAQAEEKGLEVFVDIAPDTPLYFLGDPLRLMQVLNNLIGNATKFTDHGEIHLVVQPLTGSEDVIRLNFTVRDTGIGMTQDQLGQLFQPFSQADSSITRRFGGSGLGLSIAKKLVELMGGEIAIESSTGRGTQISFTVEAGVIPKENRNLADFGKDMQDMQGKPVLVVDDQPTSRHILSRLLQAWGLEPMEAETGEQAMKLVEEAERLGRRFYAALLDWRMPGMSGLELATRLRDRLPACPETGSMKVLMVTAYDKQMLLEHPDVEFIDAVLTKPVAPSSLFEALCSRIRFERRPGMDAERLVPNERLDGLQVLLVEDHDMNQEIAAHILKQYGAVVTIAWHGAQAVEQVKQKSFDLVLMDLHMPVMGGFEAARLIRELPAGQALPIVAMTAAVLDEDRLKCREAGMNDFIPKPVEPEDVFRILRRYVANPIRCADPAAERLSGSALLNLPKSLNRLCGDRALQQRLLLNFLERYRDFGRQLEELLAAGDRTAAADAAHALKGLAANLGAEALAEACRTLGKELASVGEVQTAGFNAVLAETLRRMQQSVIDQPQDSGDTAASEQLPELLAALQPYIFGHEVLPDPLHAALRRKATDGAAPQLQKLLVHLDEFDHEAAVETFSRLQLESGRQ